MATIASQPQSIQPLHDAWGFIDRVYCISLDHRLDRQQQAKDQFLRVGLGDRVEFLLSKKHPTNAELGNFNAQMNALRTGIAAGAKHILVFEDDIEFDRFSPEQLNRAISFMKSDAGWHMFFLGCFVKSSRRTKYPSVLNVKFRSTTHAYVVTREFAQKLVETPWPGRCLDDLICSLNDDRMYAIYPAFAFQSNSPTDNDKQIGIDRFRRALGGIRRLQKWNEFASLHFVTLIVVHATIVLLGLMIAGHFLFR